MLTKCIMLVCLVSSVGLVAVDLHSQNTAIIQHKTRKQFLQPFCLVSLK